MSAINPFQLLCGDEPLLEDRLDVRSVVASAEAGRRRDASAANASAHAQPSRPAGQSHVANAVPGHDHRHIECTCMACAIPTVAGHRGAGDAVSRTSVGVSSLSVRVGRARTVSPQWCPPIRSCQSLRRRRLIGAAALVLAVAGDGGAGHERRAHAQRDALHAAEARCVHALHPLLPGDAYRPRPQSCSRSRWPPPPFATAGGIDEGQSIDGPTAIALQGPGTLGQLVQSPSVLTACSSRQSAFHGYATGTASIDVLLPANSATTLAVRYDTGRRAPWVDSDFRLTLHGHGQARRQLRGCEPVLRPRRR